MTHRPSPTHRTLPSGEWPLVDIEVEGAEWLEWSAALYESYSADLTMNSGYADAAAEVAEDLERAVYLNHGVDGDD